MLAVLREKETHESRPWTKIIPFKADGNQASKCSAIGLFLNTTLKCFEEILGRYLKSLIQYLYLKFKKMHVSAQGLSLLLKDSSPLRGLFFVRSFSGSPASESPNLNQAFYLSVCLSIYLLSYLFPHVFIAPIFTEHLQYLL